MSMMRWDPFADMAQLREQVNRLFEQSLTRTGQPVAAQAWAPTVDIYETESTIVLCIELPGMQADAIDIQITGDTLTIKGERQLDREQTGRQYVRVERAYGPFQRSFTLGLPIEQTKVAANYRDGILELTLPKAEAVKPKQIKIDVQAGPTAQVIEG